MEVFSPSLLMQNYSNCFKYNPIHIQKSEPLSYVCKHAYGKYYLCAWSTRVKWNNILNFMISFMWWCLHSFNIQGNRIGSQGFRGLVPAVKWTAGAWDVPVMPEIPSWTPCDIRHLYSSFCQLVCSVQRSYQYRGSEWRDENISPAASITLPSFWFFFTRVPFSTSASGSGYYKVLTGGIGVG